MKYNAADPAAPWNQTYKGWYMIPCKARRDWLVEFLNTRGRIPINCQGGLGRKDSDLKKLEKRGIIKFERQVVGTLCSTHTRPKRITYVVLVKDD